MLWLNRSWDSSRPNCIATRPSSPTTVVIGRDSTTSKLPRVRGCHGSTTSACTANSTIARRPKWRRTIVTQIKLRRPERTKLGSLQETGRFNELRSRGKTHRTAIRQVANRWVGILHACLERGCRYDEELAWIRYQNIAA